MLYNINAFRTMILLVFFSISCHGQAQKKNHKSIIVGFYNLENLFDTIDDPATNDAEFLPEGTYKWTAERYQAKLSNMAKAIAAIGSDINLEGPAIIGLAEVENPGVLQDLINTPPLKGKGYKIVHYDSPDERGIDVALLYKPSLFTVINSTSNRLVIPGEPGFYTRNQMVVTGKLEGEQLSLIVNHWPSRRSGPAYREKAAVLCRHLSDSLSVKYKNAKIIIMGDLNDDPTDNSVAVSLGAKGVKEKITKGELFDPMVVILENGSGSLTYKGKWNLFDQIIVSEPLLDMKTKGWKYDKAAVFSAPFLLEQEGKYAGNPLRTFVGEKYFGGYSDHLPVYLILKNGR